MKAYDSTGAEIATTSIEQPYGYTGRELDKETDLYYYRARYYSSSAGRFVSEDPIGFGAGDANLYRYVSNNPQNGTDPTGLSELIFDRVNNQILIIPGEGINNPVFVFPASNRARNMSVDPFLPEGYGPAPGGTFSVGNLIETGQGVNDAFGSFFVPINLTPKIPYTLRTGVGIHPGRASSPRGEGFAGTKGCIRTIEGVGDILRNDPPTSITIR